MNDIYQRYAQLIDEFDLSTERIFNKEIDWNDRLIFLLGPRGWQDYFFT